MTEKIRYQHQPWYMRLYLTLRHDTFIPFRAVRIWWYERKDPDPEWQLNFRECWGLARGLTDVDKNHLYDWNDGKFLDDILDEES